MNETYRPTDEPEILLARVRPLLAEARFAEAEAILGTAIRQYPDDVETSASFAIAAAGREDWPEAAARWKATLARFPSVRTFHGAAAAAYAKAGLVEQADALLELCLADDEDAIAFRVLHAQNAHDSGRWTAAAERWNGLMQLDRSNGIYRHLRGEALWQAEGAAGQETIRSLLLQFESLGDNCEFGLVQRHFGTEPAGLYRFSAITPERVAEVLNLGLAPLGDPEHTVVESAEEEYLVHDRRGYFSMHTFVPVSQMDSETLLRRQQARITILKRKMLFQLQSGNRVFIVKDSSARISDGTLRRVFASLRRHGPNRLLGVRHAEADHPPGTIERLDDGILVGYVATMFGRHDEVTDYWSWIEILREAADATCPHDPAIKAHQVASA